MSNKNTKLQIVLLIAIVLVGVLVSSVLYLKNSVEIFDDKLFNLNLENEQNKDNILSLLENERFRIESDDLSIDKDQYIFKSETDSVTLDNLVKKHERLLVFRYSELNCMICVDQEIVHLVKLLKETKTKIIIITTYIEIQDLFLFKRTNQLADIDIYNLKEPFVNIPIENYDVPYYFVFDSGYKLRNLFVPNKLYEKQSKKYLGYICE